MEKKRFLIFIASALVFLLFVCVVTALFAALVAEKEMVVETQTVTETETETEAPVIEISSESEEETETERETEEETAPEHYDLSHDLAELYAENPDIIGWLRIDGTVIDYPVMQTLWDEDYYLYKDFYGHYDVNGSLLMDTDSEVGVGTAEFDYAGGTPPSTNLIIHGHTMRSGAMFGDLDLYESASYGSAHSIINFDSLYEHREYTLISAFYSQVYYADQDVFKYYKFFEADTEDEFDDWYENIRKLALYDTGVTAQFGDEFITLSCCAYHVDNGRFVVVGVRTL